MKRTGIGLTAALVIAAGPAGANVDDRLDDARRARARAVADARGAAAEIDGLVEQYRRVAAQADIAAAALVDAFRREAALTARLADARATLAERANAAYRTGPGAFAEVLLGSSDLADFFARQLMIRRVLLGDVEEAAVALEDRGAARRLRSELVRARAVLVERQRELEALREQMERRLAEAERAARKARVRVKALERRQRRLARMEARIRSYRRLIDAGAGQTELLALLGPDGGRGCDIPPGLAFTGETFSGLASYYGQDFAGEPTASGAIFVPELFTAAHRRLPLPSFLHVRYRGKCATVLVNDRGPYIEPRVLDLSEGAAVYLGLIGPGVDTVHAEVLAPR